MASLKQFQKNMNRRADRIPLRATAIKQQVARAVLRSVVTGTPILSGRARYSWNVQMNAPDYSYDYESFNDGARAGDWLAKMATSAVAITRATQKDSIYISNGLPYITKLNSGSSRQAGKDFVLMATIAGALVVRKERLLR